MLSHYDKDIHSHHHLQYWETCIIYNVVSPSLIPSVLLTHHWIDIYQLYHIEYIHWLFCCMAFYLSCFFYLLIMNTEESVSYRLGFTVELQGYESHLFYPWQLSCQILSWRFIKGMYWNHCFIPSNYSLLCMISLSYWIIMLHNY